MVRLERKTKRQLAEYGNILLGLLSVRSGMTEIERKDLGLEKDVS